MRKRPTKILDQREKQLRSKVIPLVNALWDHHRVEEAMWKLRQKSVPSTLIYFILLHLCFEISRTKPIFRDEGCEP